MKTKVKIICANTPANLEKQINEFSESVEVNSIIGFTPIPDDEAYIILIQYT